MSLRKKGIPRTPVVEKVTHLVNLTVSFAMEQLREKQRFQPISYFCIGDILPFYHPKLNHTVKPMVFKAKRLTIMNRLRAILKALETLGLVETRIAVGEQSYFFQRQVRIRDEWTPDDLMQILQLSFLLYATDAKLDASLLLKNPKYPPTYQEILEQGLKLYSIYKKVLSNPNLESFEEIEQLKPLYQFVIYDLLERQPEIRKSRLSIEIVKRRQDARRKIDDMVLTKVQMQLPQISRKTQLSPKMSAIKAEKE